MFMDERRYEVWEQIRQSDLGAFRKLLSNDVLQETAERAGVKVVKCALCGPNLVWLGIVAALFYTRSFAGVLSLSVRMLQLAANGLPEEIAREQRKAKRNAAKRCKHDPRGKDPATLTEEAFAKARKKMPARWWDVLIAVMTERFEQQHANLIRWKRYRLLALDGTTLTLPQDARLKTHFGTSGNGKKRTVQARLVMLQVPFVRLPWRYELCRIDEGERTIAERLYGHVRRGDLVLIDQGFWSYGAFCRLHSAGAYFGIRRFSGAKFRTIKRLSRHERLVKWNKPTGPRWRGLDLPDSLTLRIIDYRIPGFRPSQVVTNELDPKHISREEWVHMTTQSEAGRALDRRVRLRQGLYHRRWEIETSFHELKVVQKMESSLRSRTPESIRYEIAGHVVLYLLIRWLMVQAAQAVEPDGDPLGISFKHAFEELCDTWTVLTAASPQAVAAIVRKLIQNITAHQVPHRPGRHEPRPTDAKTKNLGNGKYKKSQKLTPSKKQS